MPCLQSSFSSMDFMSSGSTLVATDCEREPTSIPNCVGLSYQIKAPSPTRHNLKASSRDGGFYGVMAGMGESYLPAFALAMGMGEVVAGLVVSVPMLIGGLVQLSSHRAVRWVGSEQRWIVLASLCQALAFVPLIAAAFVGSIPVWTFFAVVSFYWASGLSAGPTWNHWISKLVPHGIRPRYFSRRTRLIQLTTFGSFLLGGAVLSLAVYFNAPLLGFATLFTLALTCRLISVRFLALHREPASHHTLRHQAKLATVAPSVGKMFVWYLVCMQFFVQLSGPFFVPFMMKKLDFTYGQFALLMGSALIGKVIAMPLWGELVKRSSSRTLLLCGGLGIIPLSWMWTFSHHMAWLTFTQFASGVTWAAYELGFFMVFVNDICPQQRSRLMTRYSFLNATSWFCGSMLGGALLALGHASVGSYHWLFTCSTLGRLVCVILLWQVFRAPAHPNESTPAPSVSSP